MKRSKPVKKSGNKAKSNILNRYPFFHNFWAKCSAQTIKWRTAGDATFSSHLRLCLVINEDLGI